MGKLINNNNVVVIVVILFWVIICICLSTINAASDGINKIGWPFAFYIYYSGKRVHFENPPGFFYVNFLKDVAIVGIFTLIICISMRKLT